MRGRMEIVNVIAAIASLMVATVALFLAHAAWKRPFPADPTQVPSWGAGEDAERRVLNSPADGLAFFKFVEANAGRKVRISLELGPYYAPFDDSSLAPSESGFYTPSEDCLDIGSPELIRRIDNGGPMCEHFKKLNILS